ncbi:MAG: dual specificity protein phosphatase family protein [Chlamydiales bacterium]|nr:dual specificity protein phosphatase family protein [Chlamydiales bacterium]
MPCGAVGSMGSSPFSRREVVILSLVTLVALAILGAGVYGKVANVRALPKAALLGGGGALVGIVALYVLGKYCCRKSPASEQGKNPAMNSTTDSQRMDSSGSAPVDLNPPLQPLDASRAQLMKDLYSPQMNAFVEVALPVVAECASAYGGVPPHLSKDSLYLRFVLWRFLGKSVQSVGENHQQLLQEGKLKDATACNWQRTKETNGDNEFANEVMVLVFQDGKQIDRVQDKLYIAGEIGASNFEQLKANGITAVVCMAGEYGTAEAAAVERPSLSLYKDMGIEYLSICMEDTNAPIDFEGINRWIKEKQQGGNVLVHCQEGRSRSGAVVIASMLETMNPNTAREVFPRYLQARGGGVIKESKFLPNEHFLFQLECYAAFCKVAENESREARAELWAACMAKSLDVPASVQNKEEAAKMLAGNKMAYEWKDKILTRFRHSKDLFHILPLIARLSNQEGAEGLDNEDIRNLLVYKSVLEGVECPLTVEARMKLLGARDAWLVAINLAKIDDVAHISVAQLAGLKLQTDGSFAAAYKPSAELLAWLKEREWVLDIIECPLDREVKDKLRENLHKSK